eukprot:TRINITY_DN7001_c0_g1_i2.p1 TRINITY_DN7001_c0_g1~~TRINITY_DN7001_c0_g1_i2.p1  ORF type:complete len:452 (+),score=82.16 TRINITY_DN7001_c0_g1_i2:77-1432(+)
MNWTDYNANLDYSGGGSIPSPAGGGSISSPAGARPRMQHEGNSKYQHFQKLKEKVRILEEDNAVLRQSFQDQEPQMDIDQVEMPELMVQNRLNRRQDSETREEPDRGVRGARGPSVGDGPGGGARAKVTSNKIAPRDDLLELDLIDVDSLEGNEENWLTGPLDQEKEDDDCLEWLRSDMEANKDSLLETRIFHRISFNSSHNSSGLSGCSRDSSKIGSPENASTPAKPYRGLESRNVSGLSYQQSNDLSTKLRLARNSGYHRLAYGGSEDLNRTVDLGEDRRLSEVLSNSAYSSSSVLLENLDSETFPVESSTPLSTPLLSEKTASRRLSNINTATITRPRSMKTVIRTSDYANKLPHAPSPPPPAATQTTPQQCTDVCDTTFDKNATSSPRRLAGAAVINNGTFDGGSTAAVNNGTFDQNDFVSPPPSNRTYESRKNVDLLIRRRNGRRI